MKKMFDIYEHIRGVHYGIKVEKDFWGEKYSFLIYKNEREGWYRGEDSGALYPEYSSDIILESYDLTPVLNFMIKGITMKEFIDEMLDNWPPYAGEWYTPGSLHTLYRYLDEIDCIEKLRVYSNPKLPTLEERQKMREKAEEKAKKMEEMWKEIEEMLK